MSHAQAFKWLSDPEACASTLYLSARDIWGSELDDFEPETLRLECLHRKCEVPDENWDALMAAVALRVDGRFFIDANVFEKTVLAFNDYEIHPGMFQNAEPEWVAWAVWEACELTKDIFPADECSTDYLDYEPTSYTAVACQYDGLVVAPESLEFCADRLAELTPKHEELRSEVKKAWADIDKNRLADHAFEESAVGVQLAHLASVQLYLDEHKERCERQLSSF